MKNIWSYLAVGFAFFSAGIIVAVKWLRIDRIVYNIERFKNKRSPGGQITVNSGTKPESDRIASDRRIDRLAKRIENKKRRLLRRLEK
ncbi:MAG TPA: hypothetical protein ENH82_05390 [bacterium]|nr:hypothetical protein [bacterium]